MKRLLATAIMCAAFFLGCAWSQAAPKLDPKKGTPDQFFGITNLYTFHIVIKPPEWMKMDSVVRGQGGGRRGGAGGAIGEMLALLPDVFNAHQPDRPPPRPQVQVQDKQGTQFPEVDATVSFGDGPARAVRVRFKGNSSFSSSRDTLKHPLKLDFNDSEKGRAFFGMTKVNLNNGAMDPSAIREAIAYEIFRRAGIPASRTAFAKVYLSVPGVYTQEYLGLYTIVENVDARFLKEHFGTKDGLLVKPEGIAGLPYLGDEWSQYSRFEMRSKPAEAEKRRFIALAKLVNQGSDAEFEERIESFVDVDEFLKFILIQGAIVNMDGPLRNGHNYYIYFNPKAGKFIWMPWDLNLAFGWGGGSADLSVRRPFTSVNKLADRLLSMDANKRKYEEMARGLMATNFTAKRICAEIDAIAATVRSSFRDDKYHNASEFESQISENTIPSPSVASFGAVSERDASRFPKIREAMEMGRGPRNAYRGMPMLRQFIVRRTESIDEQLAGKREGQAPNENRPGMRVQQPAQKP